MQDIPGLACVVCHGPLEPDSDRQLRCGACRRGYPVVDGIPSFLLEVVSETPGADCALTVMIPALDEADSLDRLLPNLRRALQSLEISHEVLVVDGGSQDGTPEVAARHGARVVRQELPGFGGALRTGFIGARGRYLLELDADGSHDPAFLRDLWAARSTGEVVIASRYTTGGGAEMPRSRYVLSRILNGVFKRGLSLPVADLSSGYRLYARQAIQHLPLKATDFDILEEILIRAQAEGYRIREVPFQYRARTSGRSHARLFKFGRSYLRTFAAMWRLRNSIASADYDARAYDSIVPLQRAWQRRRYRIVSRQAAGFDTILDAGCGSSRILGIRRGMVGLDVQLNKLRYARRFGNPLVHGSIFALPFTDAAFDCVICSEVIEHIPADEKAFDELQRVLKPGGRMILGTPDYDRWSWRALEAIYARVFPGGYMDEHITHYGRANLTAYLQSRGLIVERVDYVFGSEMIFSLRKPATTGAAPAAVPVAAALRTR